MTQKMMLDFCSECEDGDLELKTGAGREYTYRRGSAFEIPAEFKIPTCTSCGGLYINGEVEEELNKRIKPLYQKSQSDHLVFLADTIRERAGVTNRQIEKACGMTPTYLSHLLKGRKEASEQIIGLLEAFAIHPSEVKRRLARSGAHDTASVKAAHTARQKHGWAPEASVTAEDNAVMRTESEWQEGLSKWSGAASSGYVFDVDGMMPANDQAAA